MLLYYYRIMNKTQYFELLDSDCVKFCNRCKSYKPLDSYHKNYKYDEVKILKICEDCRNKYKCEPHNMQKNRCIRCEGDHICVHQKLRSSCKLCYDPIRILIRNMLFNSKKSDKNKNRYDPTNFIDKTFLQEIINKQKDECHICKKNMQYVEYNEDLCTVERLDNKIGHIKSNCVLACRDCNYRNLGHN